MIKEIKFTIKKDFAGKGVYSGNGTEMLWYNPNIGFCGCTRFFLTNNDGVLDKDVSIKFIDDEISGVAIDTKKNMILVQTKKGKHFSLSGGYDWDLCKDICEKVLGGMNND